MIDLRQLARRVEEIDPLRLNGRVLQSVGVLIEAQGPTCRVGEVCMIRSLDGESEILAEVVGFRGEKTLLMPLGERNGIEMGSEVIALGKSG